jgi:eukaryotic-like serine/threonine-protein kinase
VLMAVPFNQHSMEVNGQATPLLRGLAGERDGTANVALSGTGSLIYDRGDDVQFKQVWVNRNGIEREIDPDWTWSSAYLALSPDDSRLLASDGKSTWIKTLDRGSFQRLTFEGNRDIGSVWTPDGRYVTIVSDRAGTWDLWQKRADGSGIAARIHELETNALPSAWSPDGRWLVFISPWGGDSDIYAVRPEIDSSTISLVATEFSERSPTLSPDGRWFAYSSDQTGRFEVYVRPFPNSDDGVWLVSKAGGRDPTWAQNGRELFYVNRFQEMVVATVETSPTFRRIAEQVLFSTAAYQVAEIQHNYAVSHDDQRFAMNKRIGSSDVEVMLTLNFFEELKQRVGNGND